MPDSVLDASALLALLQGEPGAEQVTAALAESAISAVNLSEVVGKLGDGGMPPGAIRESLEGLALEVLPFDSEQAYEAGLLRVARRVAVLSLGDRACLALAETLDVPALTADGAWRELRIGAEVRLIR